MNTNETSPVTARMVAAARFGELIARLVQIACTILAALCVLGAVLGGSVAGALGLAVYEGLSGWQLAVLGLGAAVSYGLRAAAFAALARFCRLAAAPPTPFTGDSAGLLLRAAALLAAEQGLSLVLGLALRLLRVSAAFSLVDLPAVLGAVFLYLMGRIFQYGAQLQQLSDETL